MRRLLAPPALLLGLFVAGCGSTQSASSGGTHGSGSGSGSTGGQLVSCNTNRDCPMGVCQVSGNGQKYCQLQCTTDADCSDPAAPMCNSRGQCVPRPATSGTSTSTSTSTSSGGTSATSGTSGTSGTSTTSSTSSSTTGHPPTSSTTTSGSTTSGATTGTSTSTSTSGTSTSGTTSTSTSSTSTSSTSTSTSTSGTSTTGTTSGTSTTTGGTSGGCVAGSCPSGQYCDSTTRTCKSGTGAGSLGSTCSKSSDCQSGRCESYTSTSGTASYCTLPCGTSADCPSNFACVDEGGGGICLSQSVAGPFGSTDVAGSCTYNANPDTCRSAYYYCTPGNYCTDICQDDAECAAGASSNFACIISGGYTFCSGLTGANSCSSDADCDGISGACQTDPNGSGKHCLVGQGCSSDSQCSHNFCVTSSSRHFCSMPCCTQADCPGTQDQLTCLPQKDSSNGVHKVCVDTPSGSSISLGAACNPQSPTDCYSGLCQPFDRSNPSTTSGYCTTTCCTDRDCQSFSVQGSSVSPRCVLASNGLGGQMGVCELP